MKKTFVLSAGLCVALAFTSCKSSENAYRKAYEKAIAQQKTEQSADNDASVATNDNATATPAPVVTPVETSAPVVAPLQEKPATQVQTTKTAVDNATVRAESVTVIDGAGIKTYSVVVGSFGLKANAIGLEGQLKSAGYQAQVAFNAGAKMYRVIASTSDSKDEAVTSRDQLRSKYEGAWLLLKK